MVELSERAEQLVDAVRMSRRQGAEDTGPPQHRFVYSDQHGITAATAALHLQLASIDASVVAVLSRSGHGILVRAESLDPFALGPRRYAVAEDGSWVIANPGPGELAIVGALLADLEMPADH